MARKPSRHERRKLRLRYAFWRQDTGPLSQAAGVPLAIAGGEVTVSANLDGTITVAVTTLPDDATGALVRYNVDQAAAPSATYLGIELGELRGTGTLTLTGCEYGATYRFSVWPYGPGGIGPVTELSVVGPFNPNVYSATAPNLWIDARRETPVADDSLMVAADQTGTQSISAATAAPHYRTAGNGIGAVAAFEGYRASDATARGLLIGTAAATNLDGAGGYTEAFLLACNDAATGTQTVFSKWDSSGDQRGHYLTKTTGEYLLYVSGDGAATVTCQTTSMDDTDPHGMVATFKPSTHIQLFVDGTKEGETTASIPAALFHSATEDTRFMLARHPAGDPFRGMIAIAVTWPTALSEMAAGLLSDNLAAIGGV